MPRLCLFKDNQNVKMTYINPCLSRNKPLLHVTDFDDACHRLLKKVVANMLMFTRAGVTCSHAVDFLMQINISIL